MFDIIRFLRLPESDSPSEVGGKSAVGGVGLSAARGCSGIGGRPTMGAATAYFLLSETTGFGVGVGAGMLTGGGGTGKIG